MQRDNYFVLTGAMGSGKSTVLKLASSLGILGIQEPAREVLKEQRTIKALGVPESSPELFVQLMLSRSTQQYLQMEGMNKIVLFDRGIPDQIAYAQLFGLDLQIYKSSSESYRYNRKVFFFEAWESIYENDDERKMTFLEAKEFGKCIIEVYTNLGYNLIKVGNSTPKERLFEIINNVI